jgi:hypothetical protein
MEGVIGDVILVNGALWPVLEHEDMAMMAAFETV